MDISENARSWRTLVVAVLLLVSALSGVWLWKAQQRREVMIANTLSNARQIGLALLDFNAEYDRLPDPSTAEIIKTSAPVDWKLPDRDANGIFSQLLVVDLIRSEDIFHFDFFGAAKPHHKKNGMLLERGECGFAFIRSGDGTVNGPAERPLVVAPLVTRTQKFDPMPFGGKAMVIRLDGLVELVPIQSDGTVRFHGKDLFDPDQAYWSGVVPVVKWPDLPTRRGIDFPTWARRPLDEVCAWIAIVLPAFLAAGVMLWPQGRDSKKTDP